MIKNGIDLSAYIPLVGQDLPQPEQYNYEVTRDSVRHFAYAIPDPNGLYLDEEYARTTRWGGIIAPPGYLYSHGYSTWLRTFPGLRDAEGRELSTNDNAEEAWEFFKPVRLGDVIHSYGKVLAVDAKRGKRIGDFALVQSEMRYTNQRNELVARAKGTSFRFNARNVASGGGMAKIYPPMPPGQFTRSKTGYPELPGMFPTPVRRYDGDLKFAEIHEGDAIPTWELGPLSNNHLAKFHAAILGIGWDQFEAIQAGTIPDAFAPGPMRIPWFGALLSRWAGPNAWIVSLSQQNREWLLVGFTAICGGTVTRKWVENGRQFVACDVWCDCDLGFRTNVGKAVVELPG
jgi:acyl dehydratase